jgi:hypothetical protein
LCRKYFIKHVTEGKIKGGEGEEKHVRSSWVTFKRGRCWNFKDEALDRTLWGTAFGKAVHLL